MSDLFATAGPAFPVEDALERVRLALDPYPTPALFQLADEGFGDVFAVLVGCIISIRTLDEVLLPTARRLFALARTPQAMAALAPDEIAQAIAACTFPENKARQIHAIARRVVDEFGGALPCDFDTLTGFNGVGPKCAGLALGIACNEPRIAVDTHVHRVQEPMGPWSKRARRSRRSPNWKRSSRASAGWT
jgi:endonuclease-3